MLISFIITAYNLPEGMVHECIDSVLSVPLDTCEREIILIDDGSDVSVYSEIEDIKDQVVFMRQANSGLSAARNRGLSIASGDYIQFVDGDDFLLPDCYWQCIKLLEEKPDIVSFNFTDDYALLTNGKRSSITLRHNAEKQKLYSGTAYMSAHNLRAAACGYIFKKQLADSLRFTPGIFHEDEEFTPLLFLRADRIVFTNIVTYFYRPRQGSIIKSNDSEHISKRLNDFFQVIVRLRNAASNMPADKRRALMRRTDQLSMDYIYNVMKLTGSSKCLEQNIEKMRRYGLFPLAKHNYTFKYSVFRIISQTRIGRLAALKTIR